jgi:hypothetical protein
MTAQITLEKALELVEFELCLGGWRVKNVKGDVHGDVLGNVCADVWGDVQGTVQGNVLADIWGTISGRQWEFIETPKEKLRRLIDEDADKDQLLAALDQLEDFNG